MNTETALRASIRKNPTDVSARLALSDLLEEEGKIDEAEQQRIAAKVEEALPVWLAAVQEIVARYYKEQFPSITFDVGYTRCPLC